MSWILQRELAKVLLKLRDLLELWLFMMNYFLCSVRGISSST